MDTLTFLAKLAWPLVGLILGTLALLIFRRPITEALGRVARAKIPGGIDLTLDPSHEAPEDREITALADAKLAELERELEQKLEPRLVELEQQQTTTSQALFTVMHEVGHALVASRRVDEEARQETVSEGVLRTLRTAGGPLSVDEIIARLVGETDRPRTMIDAINTLRATAEMVSEGILDTSAVLIGFGTEVSLVNE